MNGSERGPIATMAVASVRHREMTNADEDVEQPRGTRRRPRDGIINPSNCHSGARDAFFPANASFPPRHRADSTRTNGAVDGGRKQTVASSPRPGREEGRIRESRGYIPAAW